MKKQKEDVAGAPLFPSASKPLLSPDTKIFWNNKFEDFPMEPLAITGFARAIIQEIPMSEFKTKSGIAIVTPAGQPGQKRTYPLGRVLAVSQIMSPTGELNPFPSELLKPGDIVSFSDITGNWQRLKWGDDHIECGVIGSMDIIAKFKGKLEDIFIGAVQPIDSLKKNDIEDVGTITHKNSAE